MAGTIVQVGAVNTGAGSCSPTIGGVVAGNAVFCLFWQPTSAVRTYTVVGFTLGRTHNGDTRFVGIYYLLNSAGGTVNPTVQSNTGTTSVSGMLVEVSGMPLSSPTTDSDVVTEAGNADAHVSAAAAVDFEIGAYVACVNVLSAAVSNTDDGLDYTEIVIGTTTLVQHKIAASTSSDQGDWISNGTDRAGRGVMFSMNPAAAGALPKSVVVSQAVNRASTY